jgi:cytosine/adenosine deaminase-related metal-dependent hydrolase
VSELLLRNASRILRGGPDWREESGDLLIRSGTVVAVGGDLRFRAPEAEAIDVQGLTLLPGLVQTHVHVCQTLFRGLAEDLALLPWLRERIWPLEAAHDPASLRASAELSVLELLLGGTTTVLDMGTTHHHDSVFEVFRETGLRATSGKAMMDEGEGVPLGLLETTIDSLRESFDLAERWHEAENGRLRYAFAPRFVLSSSDALFREVVSLAQDKYLLHTHASENRDETKLVLEIKGRSNVEYFDEIGFLSPTTLLAHCIWLSDSEIELLARSGAKVAHCPQTNLKLGSGIAEVQKLRAGGVHVTLGCDGAPANNTLDAFAEMRAAFLLGSFTSGPGSLPAREILTMATRGGAEALGWDGRIGRLDPGMEADVIAIDLETPHATPCPDAVTALVSSAKASDVRHVLVQGELLVKDGEALRLDAERILRTASEEASRVAGRAAEHGFRGAPAAHSRGPGARR